MTTVRIAHAEPRPGKLENGGFQTLGHLVVLADDAGHRAVPVWLRGEPGVDDLAQLIDFGARPDEEMITAGAPEELTTRLLRAAGAGVTGVDIDVTGEAIDQLSPQAAAARIWISTPAGTRQVTAGLALGLAMAAAADVPVRLADEVLTRVAVPVPGDDLLGPLLGRVPRFAQVPPGHGLAGWPVGILPGKRPRFAPRNLDFADGLDRWDLDSGSHREADPSGDQDYTVAAEGESAVLSSSVPRPAGSAALIQSIFADDYRGATVVFRGDIRTEPRTEQAGLRLEILRHWWRVGRPREDHGRTVAGGHRNWTGHEITVLIPEDAEIIRFGIILTGTGSIALRNPELRIAEPSRRALPGLSLMNAEIPDGDLVRLARDGDRVAFRLLVERHQPMARARARSLCGNPSDVDDVVQESFLRAFIGLDRLRDPDRFAGWLGSITANVCRGLQRRAPVTLLPDWPEPLHPAAAHGLPSADDLDRADAVRAAVAGLPAGQRRAVALHYYADLPAGEVAGQPGAARASLHKARLRLRAYLTEHRPDLVPAASRRLAMTTVRIAGTESRIPPGPSPIGFPADVILLADDAGRRVLPLWVQDFNPRRLSRLFEPSAGHDEPAGTGEESSVDELTVRLLRAAGARVTGVDIDELGPEVAAARITLASTAGTQHVTTRVAEGLAVAITSGAPVRVAQPVMDRLAVPLPAHGPVQLPEPAAALAVLRPATHPRYEPRNLAFAAGLDGWLLGGSFTGHASHSHWEDYNCAAEDGIAVLSAAVPRPAGFAFLGQEMFAVDYRGAVISFGGEFRAYDTAGTAAASRAGLFLRVVSEEDARRPFTERAATSDPATSLVTIPGDLDWTSQRVTARVPEDSNTVIFGVFLAGPGRIEMRNADLTRDA